MHNAPVELTARVLVVDDDAPARQLVRKYLVSRGAVVFEAENPYFALGRLTDADIDFGAGTLVSPNPARVTYEGNETTGQSVSITGGGKKIVFDGGVRTTILPAGSGSGTPAVAGEQVAP